MALAGGDLALIVAGSQVGLDAAVELAESPRSRRAGAAPHLIGRRGPGRARLVRQTLVGVYKVVPGADGLAAA